MLACGGLGGCGLFGGSGDDCVSQRKYFEETAWPEVLGAQCVDCHSPGGPAGEALARFELLPPGYPGFIDANLERIATFAKTEYEGRSVLLLKALGQLEHGGGRRLTEGSSEFSVLERLVEQLQGSNDCQDVFETPSFEDVEQLAPVSTFRKAALHLAYRLPRAKELDELVEKGEEALPQAIDRLLEEDAFSERLKDIFNDRLLTDRYLSYTGAAVDLLNESMYPEAGEPWDELEDDELKAKINRAIAREPLELIAYLVKHNRPFTGIVKADFALVNPFSAAYYNAEVSFENPSDEREFREAKRRAYIGGELVTTPHAGVLTTPMWLNRFPTTDTNRNRHRARVVLEQFLATDILKVGDRPLDPTAATRYVNPTRDDPSCNSCHKIIDPIAGIFQKYDDNDAERYRPDRSWYMEMDPPGFGKESMTVEDASGAPEWAATRIAEDPRFAQAMVRWIYGGLMGRSALDYPTDTKTPLYSERLAAWNAQDSIFRRIAQQFVESDFNLKLVIREIVLSPYYRTGSAVEAPDDAQQVGWSELGTGRLSTPELLARKIEAVTGQAWIRGWDKRDQLTSSYRILYGGIDSEAVTKRLEAPNGVMANVALRMANEVACNSVALDFNRKSSERFLFRFVETDDVPETSSGDEVAAAIERIRRNIQHLHMQLLGEEVALDSEELEHTYQLFLDTWREGQGFLKDGSSDTVGDWLVWQCQARVDPKTGEELPEEQRLNKDPNYTVRAWMAVLSYLLSDYKFLYE